MSGNLNLALQMCQLLLDQGVTFDEKDQRAIHWAAYSICRAYGCRTAASRSQCRTQLQGQTGMGPF